MKKDKKIKKLFDNYQKLNDMEKIIFQNKLNKDNERMKLEDLSLRSSVANQLMNDLKTPDGQPYFNVDWIVKNIMKLSDKDINDNGKVIIPNVPPKDREKTN